MAFRNLLQIEYVCKLYHDLLSNLHWGVAVFHFKLSHNNKRKSDKYAVYAIVKGKIQRHWLTLAKF